MRRSKFTLAAVAATLTVTALTGSAHAAEPGACPAWKAVK